MRRYFYDGPVMEFGRCIETRWQAATDAPSASKARSNLLFQFKKMYNKVVYARIELPGEIQVVERKDEKR